MHFLLLKVASAVGMGLVLKRADGKGIARLPVVRVNYAVAAVLAFACALATNQTHISRPTALLAVGTGVVFVAGLVFWAKAIEVAGLALSVVAMRLAIILPVLASILVWRERPTSLELVGSAVALMSLGLVLSDVRRAQESERAERKDIRTSRNGAKGESVGTEVKPGTVPVVGHRHQGQSRFSVAPAWLWLLGLFVVDGLVMLPAQIFRKELPSEENLPFQTVIFVAAFAVTTIVYYAQRARVDQKSLVHGALLGVANLGNYLFLVLALTVLPGIVVYPVIAAGEVALMAFAGVFVWRERVGLRSWFGIGLAVIALVLIQVGRAAV